MDLRAYYIQAAEAEAAAAVHTTEDDVPVPKLTPKAVLLKLEVQGIGLGGDANDAPALPRYGKSLGGQGNGVAPMGMDNDKAAEGGGARDLTCPECGKTFLSDKAMYGHLRCHPGRGYKGATPPADAATAAVVGGKKPRKVPRKEAEISTMIPAATASVAGDKKHKKVPWKEEAELSTRWPVTVKRGRLPPAANAGSAAPVAVLQSACSEEEAAMILLAMSSRGQRKEPELPMQPVHVADAVAGHQMPGVEQPMLPDHVTDAVAMHHVQGVEQPMIPDHVAVAGQHMWEAEKPAQLERVFKVVMESHEPEAEQALRLEHVAKVTAGPQTPEVKKPMKLEIVTDAVLVVVRTKNSGPADNPVSPGAKNKKCRKRRLLNLEQTPASPPPEASDVKPPARRIPSPASDMKYGCPPCHKTFSTHQALGGHMASHNKGKYGGVQHDDGLAVAHAVHNTMVHHHRHGCGNAIIAGASGNCGELWDSQPAPMAQSPAQHPCSRCDLTFPTGQALGGHMRKHWLADKLLAKAAAAAAAAPPSGVPRDFDLNELPRE